MELRLEWDYKERNQLISECLIAINKAKDTSLVLSNTYLTDDTYYLQIVVRNQAIDRSISIYLTFAEIKGELVKHNYMKADEDMDVNLGELIKVDRNLKYAICQHVIERVWFAVK